MITLGVDHDVSIAYCLTPSGDEFNTLRFAVVVCDWWV